MNEQAEQKRYVVIYEKGIDKYSVLDVDIMDRLKSNYLWNGEAYKTFDEALAVVPIENRNDRRDDYWNEKAFCASGGLLGHSSFAGG